MAYYPNNPNGQATMANSAPVTIASNQTALPITDDSGSLTVDNATISVVGSGTEATAQRVTIATDSTGVLSVDDNGGSLTVDNATISVVGTGTEATAQRVTIATDSTGVLSVDDNGSSLTVDGTVTASNTAGDVAHDAADSGNPVKIGGVAKSTEQTAVATGDRVNFVADLVGKQIILPYANPENFVSGNGSNTDGTTTSLISAQGAGIRTYITSIVITNTSASNIYVEFKDDITAKYTIPAPANSGAIITLPTPLVGTANKAWWFDPSTAATTIYCSAAGYKGV